MGWRLINRGGVGTYSYLVISEFTEGIHNNTKDDVQSYRCDDNEEGQVEHRFAQVEVERLAIRDLQELETEKRGKISE